VYNLYQRIAMNNLFVYTQQQAQLHRLGGVDWAHVNTADALMSFNPDPSWDPATLQAKIKVFFHSLCFSFFTFTF
jgi:hypothetical protein